ncbi:MAG: glycosyltransferase family 2 protein [Ruminococcus sp.]|nr:glycosyltransferase family 2 protein [Ruminococcus sp.]
MKANVKKHTGDGIVLSIGMIVKNEEKHLDNCLSALKKFMDQISCELIIVDTGSTDRTKEIAYKYTDQVYDFEWIDDFSAARNFGLEKAKGKWFMFLDADEYLDEDCSQLVTFFQHPEAYEKFNSGTYIVRSYTNLETGASSDFQATRLIKLDGEVRFHGKIHESLPFCTPLIYFDTLVHHYGYIHDDPHFKEKRFERNMPMMLAELDRDPEDGRMVGSIVDICEDTVKETYVERALELNQLERNVGYRNANMVRAINHYMQQENHERVLAIVEDYFAVPENINSVSKLHMYCKRADTYVELKEYDKAAENYEQYMVAYEEYKSGKLNILDIRMLPIYGCSDYEHEQIRWRYISVLSQLKRFDKVAHQLEQFDIAALSFDSFRSYLASWREVLHDTKDYKKAAQLYERVLCLADESKTELVLYMLEQYYQNHMLEREDFVRALADSGVDGLYIELMQIVKAEMAGEDVTARLYQFLSKPTSWKEGYTEAIYLCLKYGLDLSSLVAAQNYQVLRSHFPKMAMMHTDYSKQVLWYCRRNVLPMTLRALSWTVSALETAVLSSRTLYADGRNQLYDLFVCTLSDYINNIYNPELLNEDDIAVLPELHQFGYYMTLAFQARNQGDGLAYIRNLRKAVACCEPMKDLVSFYQTQFADALKQKQS